MPKLLILSSNPRRDLNLDREVSDLTTAVQRLEEFEIGLGLGVRSRELPELLAEHTPQIVHFCGHGAGEQGLVFQDELGQERFVSTQVLARLFKAFQDEVNCVVLNACDSDRQAEAIVAHVNYVVGMSQPILDQAAHIFAVGFYKGLAAGKSIEQAYELGCVALQIWSEENAAATHPQSPRKAEYVGESVEDITPAEPLPEYLKPVLWRKNGLAAATASYETYATPSAALSNLPQGFEQAIHQEIDRKEYKDQARTAYDNFGQYSAQKTVSLSKAETEQRKILVHKVKEFWIEGFLKPSLQGAAAVRLDLKARPDAIADLSQGIEALSIELDASYEQLRATQLYREIGQGRTLLLLGEPGAGKTIALLQLAERLIERCEQDVGLPMPVVLNLSSWAKEQTAIADWLIDELREKYQVHTSLSLPWLTQQQFILLLDGLDEVNQEHRNACVRALNEYIELYPQTSVAICSRVRDYESLTDRLHISSALCLQPLSSRQIYQFLDSVGGPLVGLKALLKNDQDIEQFAQTPLILSLMSIAYQGWSVENLLPQLRSPSHRLQHLCDTYLDRRLARGAAAKYSRGDILRWLSWLAGRMVQEKQTVFLIEKMQPTWLQNRSEQRLYQIVSLVVGFIAGRSTVSAELDPELGLIIRFVIGQPINAIIPVEQLSWSWQKVKSRFIQETVSGALTGLFLWLLSGGLIGIITSLIAGNNKWLLRGLVFGLFYGLGFGLLFALGSGVDSTEITQRTVPNQGMRRSLRNGLIIGLVTGVLTWLMSWLVFNFSPIGSAEIFGLRCELLFGLIGGLSAGLKYGGAACVQHLTLRLILFRKKRIPWNYARFLAFAADRLLMKKIGGGYIFFHRILLEHFAQMHLPTRERRGD